MRGWLTAKPDPEFDPKCADVCTVYKDAAAAASQDVRTVSVDEMTGVQALERAAPDLPMRPGPRLFPKQPPGDQAIAQHRRHRQAGCLSLGYTLAYTEIYRLSKVKG